MIGTQPSPIRPRSDRAGLWVRWTGPARRMSATSRAMAIDREGERRAEEGALDAEAGADEDQAEDEPAAGLADDAQADRAVRAQALQRAALEREHREQDAGGEDGGGRPRVVVHADQGGERLAQQDGRGGHGHEGHEQSLHPGLQRAPHDGRGAEAVHRRLAGGGDLHGLARDHEDQERRDERRQRPVARRARAGA